MWVCKFMAYDKENEIREIVEKCEVKIYYYPINYYVKRNRYFFIAVAVVEGENKKKFFRELNKLKKSRKRKIDFLEVEGDFFTIITSHTINKEQRKYVNVFYNPALIHISPIKWNKDGWEEWETASVDRKVIENIIKIGEEVYDLKLLKFRQEKIKNFGFLTMLPELTDKQNKAIKLALEHGYYSYPRKTSLHRLAKIAKLSFSTFQAHVRKAENRILSYVVKLEK